MLQTLRVKNLALVENAVVDFQPGLNMITGETGAGKSILIGALGLLLGDRADKTLIRSGEDQCGAEALFALADPAAINRLLKDHGIEPCTDGQLIVRRLVAASGVSRNYINGAPATLQLVKILGDLLVDMHGPHDHQSLLSQEFQLELLDAFGRLAAAREAYAAAYAAFGELQTRRKALEGDAGDVARQIDFLRFQCRELEAAKLDEQEDAAIEQEHAVAANTQRIRELAAGIQAALAESDGAALNALAAVYKGLNELAALYPQAAEWRARANSVSIELRELAADLSRALDKIESDPARLQWLEERMALYQKLKRKYRATVPELRRQQQQWQTQLRDLENRDAQLADLDQQIAETRRRAETAGRTLSRERAGAAGKLAQAITRELRDLGFPHGAFEVSLAEADLGPSGMNSIEFTFAPNVGEAARPLRAIASSGEISRVMLAVKAVLARHDRIPVLIFDEIDANVGGEMGGAVGAKLAAVAQHHQVLCITHLPQVAVYGAAHLAVEKEVRDGRTRTQIRPLAGEARVEEIARMLGGKDSTTVALRHAREMLKKA
jgi:DNA repair protein RecN (Recombination protein N)